MPSNTDDLENRISTRGEHLWNTAERLRGTIERASTRFRDRATDAEQSAIALLGGAIVGLFVGVVWTVVKRALERRASNRMLAEERQFGEHHHGIEGGLGRRAVDKDTDIFH